MSGFREKWRRFADGDVAWSFRHSPVACLSLAAVVILFALAFGAPLFAPQVPFDLASIDISDASLPPAWMEEGSARYLLGTDDQGRDLELYHSRRPVRLHDD